MLDIVPTFVEPFLVIGAGHGGHGEGADEAKGFEIAVGKVFAGEVVARGNIVGVAVGGGLDPVVDAGEEGGCAGVAGHEIVCADMPGHAAGVEIIYSIVFRFQVIGLYGLSKEVDVV